MTVTATGGAGVVGSCSHYGWSEEVTQEVEVEVEVEVAMMWIWPCHITISRRASADGVRGI